MRVLLLVTSFIALARAAPLPEDGPISDLLAIESAPYPVKVVDQPPMPYEFNWAVKDAESKNDYAHEEKSDGRAVTGSYRVLLPDGRNQIVTYKSDENGYVATVRYEETASYSEPKPTYKKQTPSYPSVDKTALAISSARPETVIATAQAEPVPVVVPSGALVSDLQPVSVQASASSEGQGEISASAVAISSSS